MKLSKIALMMATLAASSAARSHGYIEVPESRAYKCKLGSNTDCGRAQWNRRALSRFPASTAALRRSTASWPAAELMASNRWIAGASTSGR